MGCTALAQVTFRNAEGWRVSEDYQMTNAVSIPAADLGDPAAAAQILQKYSEDYFWKRT